MTAASTPSGAEPLLPAWLQSWTAFTSTVRGAVRRALRRGIKHSVWMPWYLVKLAAFSPRGLGRVLVSLFRLLSDAESQPLRAHHVDNRESKEWIALRRERNARVKNRLIVAAVLFGLLAAAGGAAWFLLPEWSLWLVAGLTVETLGWVGRPIGKPLAKPTTLVAGSPGPLKAPFVMEALCSLSIGGMRNPSDIGLLFDVARVGPGYQCDLELPRGVDASAVLEKRGQLSAALRRELGTVWPSVGKRHQGHLVLYVSDQPMATAKQSRWPLLKDGSVNVFRPAPAFTDQRGVWVDLTLAYTSGVIGAVPRMGKTFYLRQLLLMAGLDPRCKVYAIDLKGTGDLAPAALFAHFYSVGDEEDEIAEQLAGMRDLRQEMRRRARVIRELPHERCPENKVTSELAEDRELGLEPVYVGIDECQVWFQHEDKAIREEFTLICTDLVKRGPALGIMIYFATQKPSAKSIPTDIADNAVTRIALKVAGQVPNDQVLGTSSYQSGLRATLFSFDDKGVAYLKSDGADARIVRSVAGLDAPAAEKVASRARQLRQAAGRLTGMAAGEDIQAEADQVAFLDDVRQAFTNYGHPGVLHLGDLATGLGELRAGVYGHVDNASLAKMLRSVGIKVDTVYDAQKDPDDRVAKGVKSEWLDVTATSAIGVEAEEEQARTLTGAR